jgi:hypothetical protein
MIKYIYTLCFFFVAHALIAQSFYDLNTVQTIEITFAQSNWDQLLDAEKAGNEDYIMAQSVTINGVVFDSVGVKYKGNSTYNSNQTKNPFHIELNTYKDHIYEAYTDIKLSNVAKDPSFVREVLSYQVLRQYMDAPLSNYANVSVNGTLIGLYSNSEAITKKFVNNRFYSKKNTFVKCNPPAGAGPGSSDYPNLVDLGPDSTNYYAAYELKSDIGWNELIDLCDTLGSSVNAIEDILDVDRALWMLAFDNVLVNLDSYIGGFAQNYYLYRNSYGKFIPIVWDLNESFGQFSMTGTSSLNSTIAKQQMSHLLHENDANFPLIQQLLSIPMYKRMYLAHCKTMLLENFDDGSYYTTGQALQTTIDASVQADGNKFFTYANFTANLTTDVSSGGGGGPGGGSYIGITSLMNGRSAYLLGLTDFTQTEPTISNVTPSNSAPLVNDPVSITATVQDETAVYLGYRSAQGAPFERVLMYDDGVHNDAAANDGVYGVEVTMTTLFMEYYIYADNNNIGKFSPQRAEHEYHSISAGTPVANDLVINEFLASNDFVMADQDGEYDDWIELYNNGTTTIDLENYHLSDDGADLTQWTFPAGATIAPNAYFVVWADKDDLQTGYHTNFKLSASGETIYLSDAAGSILDQVTYTTQVADTSYGRYANGTGTFQTMFPTFSAENSLVNSIRTLNGDVIDFKAHPNPASTSFNLEITEQEEQERTVIVYDIYGQLIYENKIRKNLSIQTSEWAAGMYIISIDGASLKMVVN